jgi:hypothetical protein
MIRDLIAKLTACEHVIDFTRPDVTRYVISYILANGEELQVCGLCGARRIWGNVEWTRPELVEQIARLS